jgi:hypothetical protein
MAKKLTEAGFSVKRTDTVLRAQIETILKDYGIDRAAWHGGDLAGNHCRLLIAEAKAILTSRQNEESESSPAECLKTLSRPSNCVVT